MRGLLAIIPLLVLAVHALVGQSGVMVCLGGAHAHDGLGSGVAAAGAEACSHGGAGLLLPAELGAVGHGHSGGEAGEPFHQENRDHRDHPHDDCSCTDLLIGLRDEVTVPRIHDDGQVWAAAAWVPCPWACEAWGGVVGDTPDRRRESFQDAGGACCLAIVRSTRMLC